MCCIWMPCGHKLSAACILTQPKEVEEKKEKTFQVRLLFSKWIQDAPVNLPLNQSGFMSREAEHHDPSLAQYLNACLDLGMRAGSWS